jgi:hypothetical protein
MGDCQADHPAPRGDARRVDPGAPAICVVGSGRALVAVEGALEAEIWTGPWANVRSQSEAALRRIVIMGRKIPA